MGPIVLILLVVTLTSVKGQVQGPIKCSILNCKPPDCYCPTSRIPKDINPEDVPQMIVFSFGGPMDSTSGDFIKDLFNKKRRNPNGSTLRATLFVSDDEGKTDYCTVNNLWATGHEIASFSVTRRTPENWWSTANQKSWENEIDSQKKYLIGNASIPAEHIVGFRSPHLRTGGNTQYRFAQNSNWTYDSSMILPSKYSQATQPKLWPFTMDTPPVFECYISPCPEASFPGLWQVPVQPLVDNYGKPCIYLDNCVSKPTSEEDIFNILMLSFNRSYNNNRVPMMVNFLNYKTFFEKNTPWAINGIHRFIDEVMAYVADDVWFVTYQDMIEWIQMPTDTKLIKFFPAFTRNLEDTKKMSCIEERTVESFINGVTLLIIEIVACVVAFIVLYFNDS